MTLLNKSTLRMKALTFASTLGLALLPAAAPLLRAADHADAPSISGDGGADIADAFLFLDPNDNSKVVIAMTVHGFIIPGEALNLATFDPKVEYFLNIENTGDSVADKSIKITFSPKTASTSDQIAKIDFDGTSYTAETTAATVTTANPQKVTSLGKSGIKFFAGEVDDPFFFDLVAFNRFIASVKAGKPNPAVFERGRDVFAGYNILAIAFSVPVKLLKGESDIIGLEARTKRRKQKPLRDGGYKTIGEAITVDRTGNPAVNVALIPFNRKDEYNAAATNDAKFTDDIVASLTALGTDSEHIGILADIAVTHGDFLHLNVKIRNSGTKGGTNAAAGFPNGRRPADDTIDTILTVINNGKPLGDNVDASDVPPRNTFPFFALPHQPINDTTENDDDTRN